MSSLHSSGGDSVIRRSNEVPAYDDYRTCPGSFDAEFLEFKAGGDKRGLGPVRIHLNGSTIKNGDLLDQPVIVEGTLSAFSNTPSQIMYFVTREGTRSAMVTFSTRPRLGAGRKFLDPVDSAFHSNPRLQVYSS